MFEECQTKCAFGDMSIVESALNPKAVSEWAKVLTFVSNWKTIHLDRFVCR
jgi:hypothetical protein